MGYAEECERLSSMGFSGSDASFIAGSGVHARHFVGDDDEDEGRDPDCPTEEEFDKDPSRYIWVEPFGKSFRVHAYDPTAKDGYEIYTVGEKPTRAEADQLRLDHIAYVSKPATGEDAMPEH